MFAPRAVQQPTREQAPVHTRQTAESPTPDLTPTEPVRGSGLFLQRYLGNSALQSRVTGSATPPASAVPSVVHDVLRSPGQPLDPTTRTDMEARFRTDFSQVRVHTDTQAAESSQAVGALAYTVGSHIVFGAGAHCPGTPQGRQRIAHELTHAKQQSSALGGQCTPLEISHPGDSAEREADRAATAVMAGRPIAAVSRVAPMIQRQPLPQQFQQGQIVVLKLPVLQMATELGGSKLAAVVKAGDMLKLEEPHPQGGGQAFYATVLRSSGQKKQGQVGVVRTDWIRPAQESEKAAIQGDGVQKAAERRASKIQQALIPQVNGDARMQLVETVQVVDSIKPLPDQPGYSYLMHGDERIVLHDSEVAGIRQGIIKMMDNATKQIRGVYQDTLDKWAHQLEVNRKEWFGGSIVHFGKDPSGPFAQIDTYTTQATQHLSSYLAMRRQGKLVQMAEAIANAEENTVKAKFLVDQWVEGIIKTAEGVKFGLTIARDLSLAIATSYFGGTGFVSLVKSGASLMQAGLTVTALGALGNANVRAGTNLAFQLATETSVDPEAVKREFVAGLKRGAVDAAAGAVTAGTTGALGEATTLTGRVAHGATSGFAGGVTGGTLEAALDRKSAGEILEAGVKGGVSGALGGGLSGAGNRVLSSQSPVTRVLAGAGIGAVGNAAGIALMGGSDEELKLAVITGAIAGGLTAAPAPSLRSTSAGGSTRLPRVEFASPKVWEYDGRQIVVVKTSEGPKAFYRRTGKGGESSGAQPGDWVPFDGFRSQGVENGYFMKDNYLAEGDLDRWGTEEFRQIGKQLAELDAQGKIPKGEDVGKVWRKIQAHLLRSGVKRTLSMPDEELDELAPK